MQVPFEQLVIFSTNLEPDDLVDEAFLRRIPYKIETATRTPKSSTTCSSSTPPRWASSASGTRSIT